MPWHFAGEGYPAALGLNADFAFGKRGVPSDNVDATPGDFVVRGFLVGRVADFDFLRDPHDAFHPTGGAFGGKAEEFKDIIKMGRTQLQDAVPMTLGMEFATFARMTMEDEDRLRDVIPLLCEINIGGTAIGTQLNALVRGKPRPITVTKMPLVPQRYFRG